MYDAMYVHDILCIKITKPIEGTFSPGAFSPKYTGIDFKVNKEITVRVGFN